MTALDLERLQGWIGRSETACDEVSARLVAAYCATVQDRSEAAPPDVAAPAGIHWCLAPATVPMSGVGADGHPERGGFLPPVPLPRRMWAGSRVRFGEALQVHDEVERVSTIKDVKAKTGASGELCFVTIEHVLSTARGEAVREEQDLVFRAAPPAAGATAAGAPSRPLRPPDFVRTVEATPVLLFRFSALTFNGHRIHYDRPYAREVEGYPGLVVHGPLQAALLLDLATSMRGGDAPERFEFRGNKPLFDTDRIVLAGRWRDPNVLDLSSGPDVDTSSLAAIASWSDS